MIRLMAIAAVAALWAGAACAQMPAQMMFQNGADGVTALPVSPTRPLPVSVLAGQAVTGFGKLAVTNTSALVSTLTPGPNSATWPSFPGVVDIVSDVASADVVWVCPLGGPCSASNGIPIPVGGSWRFTKPSTSMTVFSTAGGTIRMVF